MRYLVIALIFLNSSIGMSAAQAALSAAPPKLDTNKPYDTTTCNNVPDGTVTGRVTSPTTIQMPGFLCGRRIIGLEQLGAANGGNLNYYGRHTSPRLTMTVFLANPADDGRMPLGKVVTLKGDFFVIAQNKAAFLFAKNARVLYADPFGR